MLVRASPGGFMSRRSVSLLVLALVGAALFIFAPDVILTVFAGLLLAVFLRSGGAWIAKRIGLSPNWGIAIFLVALNAAAIASAILFWSQASDQFGDLSEQIPPALDQLRERLSRYSWGERLLNQGVPEGWFAEGGGIASTAVTGTFGALGGLVLILFLGLYGALDPDLYRRGLRLLLAPSARARGDAVISHAAATLRDWLAAQLIAMSVVGVMTGLGLWLVGLPLAFILGLIAGLLAFIPNIGPVLAAAPALLLAFPEGWTTTAWVLGVYIGVQALESYIITPIVQQEKVSLPPALIISMQLLFGVLFGLLGLMLATPFAALAMTLVNDIYVDDYLDREGGAD